MLTFQLIRSLTAILHQQALLSSPARSRACSIGGHSPLYPTHGVSTAFVPNNDETDGRYQWMIHLTRKSSVLRNGIEKHHIFFWIIMDWLAHISTCIHSSSVTYFVQQFLWLVFPYTCILPHCDVHISTIDIFFCSEDICGDGERAGGWSITNKAKPRAGTTTNGQSAELWLQVREAPTHLLTDRHSSSVVRSFLPRDLASVTVRLFPSFHWCIQGLRTRVSRSINIYFDFCRSLN